MKALCTRCWGAGYVSRWFFFRGPVCPECEGSGTFAPKSPKPSPPPAPPRLDSLIQVHSITIKPGDTIVLSTDRKLTPEQLDNISAQLNEAFPGVKAFACHMGAKVTVASRMPS